MADYLFDHIEMHYGPELDPWPTWLGFTAAKRSYERLFGATTAVDVHAIVGRESRLGARDAICRNLFEGLRLTVID
jgi:hypothetical protein